MKTLDRYVIREILPPFVIALLVFTFILIIPFIIELAEQMIAKGVPWPMLLRLMVTLLPSALALTIPMALLIGILVAFGRLSADREVVVMMACGISPYRLLRPLAGPRRLSPGPTSSWVLLKAMPDANQAFRELTMQIVADRAEGEVRPRVFFEDFPNTGPVRPRGPADRRLAGRAGRRHQEPGAAHHLSRAHAAGCSWIARRGPSRWCSRTARGTRRSSTTRRPTRCSSSSRWSCRLDPESVFPRTGPARGDRELSIAELRQRVAELEAAGRVHPQPGHGDPQEVLHPGRLLRVRAARPGARREQPQGRQARQLRPRHRRHLRLLRDHVLGAGA